jgi:hypothetical protein
VCKVKGWLCVCGVCFGVCVGVCRGMGVCVSIIFVF